MTEYPFKFRCILLSDRMLKKIGFGDWNDCAGDFSKSQLILKDDVRIIIYCLDEKDDTYDGYWPNSEYVSPEYLDIHFQHFYFLHELYEMVKSKNNEIAMNDFIDRTTKCNLKPFIDSYLDSK